MIYVMICDYDTAAMQAIARISYGYTVELYFTCLMAI
jgi:hypothetical protein